MNLDYKKYSFSISFIRVIATILILLCHFVVEYNNPLLTMSGQIFNVGVTIFFFMSGFMYGEKDIKDVFKWLKKRFTRIMLPIYLFLLLLVSIFFVLNIQINGKNLLLYLFNLQGLFNRYIQGAAHLWFVSVIMICYLITPLLYKIKTCYKDVILKNKNIIIVLLMLIQIIFALNLNDPLFAIYLSYIYIYVLGYVCKNMNWLNVIQKYKKFILLGLIAILLRFGFRMFLDDTNIYTAVIVPYTQGVFGISIFIVLFYWCYYEKIQTKIYKNNILNRISYEIYIVHYMYCVGPIKIFGLTPNYFFDTLIVLTLTFITAYLLNKIVEMIIKLLERRKQNV